ncbi:MAG: hypothetical protein D3910_15385 [Candidatus Electrothrix sp. ATG2]|nr:hypothetical protein [Candidatus Electrothrix sp. ATG2]
MKKGILLTLTIFCLMLIFPIVQSSADNSSVSERMMSGSERMVRSSRLRLSKPDIIVTRFQVTSSPRIKANNTEIPIRVTVRNQGGAAASTFKISTEYKGPSTRGRTLHAAFNVPGQRNSHYPRTSGLLSPGREVTFSGKVILYSPGSGAISLNAIADSCSGDEFMPPYCRVNESNEGNNKSRSLSIRLP